MVAFLLVACGGGQAPAPVAPTPPAEPEPVADVSTEPAEPAPAADAPVEPVPPPAPAIPFHERLVDPEGPVPGLDGFAITRKPNPNHCGGIQIVTKRNKKVAKDDKPLADVYALEFPKDLSFDPNDAKRREESLKKFSAWLEEFKAVGDKAQKHYEASLHAKKDVVSIARIAQISARMSSMIARAEIPKDVRTGDYVEEKKAAFCDALQQAAEPLLVRTEEAIALCAERAAKDPPGWWSSLCVVK